MRAQHESVPKRCNVETRTLRPRQLVPGTSLLHTGIIFSGHVTSGTFVLNSYALLVSVLYRVVYVYRISGTAVGIPLQLLLCSAGCSPPYNACKTDSHRYVGTDSGSMRSSAGCRHSADIAAWETPALWTDRYSDGCCAGHRWALL